MMLPRGCNFRSFEVYPVEVPRYRDREPVNVHRASIISREILIRSISSSRVFAARETGARRLHALRAG